MELCKSLDYSSLQIGIGLERDGLDTVSSRKEKFLPNFIECDKQICMYNLENEKRTFFFMIFLKKFLQNIALSYVKLEIYLDETLIE